MATCLGWAIFLRAVAPDQGLDGSLPFLGNEFDDLTRVNIAALRQDVSQRHFDEIGRQ
jgi:hypothetical protein